MPASIHAMTAAMPAPAAGAAVGAGFGEVDVGEPVGAELVGALDVGDDVGDDTGDPTVPLEQAATSADAAMTGTSRMGTRLAGGPSAASSAAGFANVG